MSIVGFDNWEMIAAEARPPLTSIDMNLNELGREAGRRLMELIALRLQPGLVQLDRHRPGQP